jgi:hypothetical protein
MTYVISTPATALQCDIITPTGVTSSTVNANFYLSATDLNTSISVSAQYITLNPRLNYYMEFAPQMRCGNGTGTIEFGIYRDSTASYIGQKAEYAISSSGIGSANRVGRKVARAMLLAADMSSAEDIYFKISSITGSGWNFTISGDVGLSGLDWIGYPTIRVWQLP